MTLSFSITLHPRAEQGAREDRTEAEQRHLFASQMQFAQYARPIERQPRGGQEAGPPGPMHPGLVAPLHGTRPEGLAVYGAPFTPAPQGDLARGPAEYAEVSAPADISGDAGAAPLVQARPHLREVFAMAAAASRNRSQIEAAIRSASDLGRERFREQAADAPVRQIDIGIPRSEMPVSQDAAPPVMVEPSSDPLVDIARAVRQGILDGQQARPIEELRQQELARAQEARPIAQLVLEDLEATKEHLQLPEEVQEQLIETLTPTEDGLIDPVAQQEMLERANAQLQEHFQAIIDDFAARVAQNQGGLVPEDPSGA